MKTPALLLAALLLTSSTLVAQESKTTFHDVRSGKAGDGLPCMELSWEKGQENTSYYLVERSADGAAFKTIALVFTAEDPGFRKFSYKDKSFGSTGGLTVYSRIAMVNDQKELTYLPVKKAALSATSHTSGSSHLQEETLMAATR